MKLVMRSLKLITAMTLMKEVLQVTLLKLVMRSGTLQYEKQAVNLMGRDEPGKRWTCLFHQNFICARI